MVPGAIPQRLRDSDFPPNALGHASLSRRPPARRGQASARARRTAARWIALEPIEPRLMLSAYFNVIDLGAVVGGTESGATHINASGQVLVWSGTYPDAHCFLYSDGAAASLPISGADINDVGQIVGTVPFIVTNADGEPEKTIARAAMYFNGQITYLSNTYAATHYESQANGINNAGTVVGYMHPYFSGLHHSFIYNGGIIDVGEIGGLLGLHDVNDSGVIIGNFGDMPAISSRAFIYQNGAPNFFPGILSNVRGINDAGDTTGWLTPESNQPFIFLRTADGTFYDLGTIGGSGWPLALNNSQQVVGYASWGGNVERAFFYFGAMFDLNNLIPAGSGWVLNRANDINDSAQIVGTGTLNGQTRAFMLERTDLAVYLIPEASTPSQIKPGDTISYLVQATTLPGATHLQVTVPTPPGTVLYRDGVKVDHIFLESNGSDVRTTFTAVVADAELLPPGLDSIVATAHAEATLSGGRVATQDETSTLDMTDSLVVRVSPSTRVVAPGGKVTYTITLEASRDADTRTVINTLPKYMKVVAGSVSNKGVVTRDSAGRSVITWKLPKGASATLTFTAEVLPEKQLGPGLAGFLNSVEAEAVIGGDKLTSTDSVNIKLARPDFDWSMPKRYGVDTNNNGLVDLPNSYEYVNPEGFSLELDANLTSLVYPFTTYDWTITCTSAATPIQAQATGLTAKVDNLPLGKYTVTLIATASDGSQLKVTKKIQLRDILIVSVGDSFSSGEGNPEIPGDPATWADGVSPAMNFENFNAHRTTRAASSQAAIKLENSNPHFSVTFVMLSISGATVAAGLIGTAVGCENESVPVRAQLPALKEIIGDRKIDVLNLSIGGNDVEFSPMLTKLLAPPTPFPWIEYDWLNSIDASFMNNLEQLALTYRGLNSYLKKHFRGQIGTVIMTDYPDPTTGNDGKPAPLLDDVQFPFSICASRSAWAHINIVKALNVTVRRAANANGWLLAGGLADAFYQHGYAATDHWFVRMAEARVVEGSQMDYDLVLPDGSEYHLAHISLGAVHPNYRGHQAIADRIWSVLRLVTKALLTEA